MAAHPDHQGDGPGRAIMQKLAAPCEGHLKTAPFANPGTEGFYRKPGSHKMNTAMALFQNPNTRSRSA